MSYYKTFFQLAIAGFKEDGSISQELSDSVREYITKFDHNHTITPDGVVRIDTNRLFDKDETVLFLTEMLAYISSANA